MDFIEPKAQSVPLNDPPITARAYKQLYGLDRWLALTLVRTEPGLQIAYPNFINEHLATY